MVAENITITRTGNDFALTVCLELIAHRVDVTNTLTSESETP